MDEIARRGEQMPVTVKATVDDLMKKADTLIDLVPSRISNPAAFIRRLARSVGHQMMKTPKLKNCSPESLLHAVMFCAEIGMAPDPASSLVHFVPFKGEVVPIVDYKGLQNLAMETGKVHYVKGVNVFEGDGFVVTEGSMPSLSHTVCVGNERTPERFIGAYAVAPLTSGGPTPFVYMSKAEIDKIRSRAPGGQGDAWKHSYLEMARKTPVRRLAKSLPLSPEFSKAGSIAENYEAGGYGTKTVEAEVTKPFGTKACTERLTEEAPREPDGPGLPSDADIVAGEREAQADGE